MSINHDDQYSYYYKHLSIDDNKYVYGIFENTNLKYTNPINFNDPFDTLFKFQFVFDSLTLDFYSKITNMSSDDFIKMKHDPSQWTQLVKTFNTDVKDSFLNSINKALDIAIKNFRNQVYITCFNKCPLHPLMWAHYADSHKGFMIEFKIPKNARDFEVHPIQYCDYFSSIPITAQDIMDMFNGIYTPRIQEIFKSVHLKKGISWAYEKEYRAIRTAIENPNNNCLFTFNPKYISTIVTGNNCQDSQEIEDLITIFNKENGTNVKVYQARLGVDEERHEIYVPNHPRLGKKISS